MLRAAIAFRDGGYGIPVLVGRDDVHDRLRALGVDDPESFELINSRNYRARARDGRLSLRAAAAARLSPPRDRADGQPGPQHLRRPAARARRGRRDDHRRHPALCARASARSAGCSIRRRACTPFGIHVLVGQSHTIFIADTTVTERPSAEQLAEIADPDRRRSRAGWATSRASPSCPIPTSAIPRAPSSSGSATRVRLLDARDDVDFEYEGEMAPDVALNPALQQLYPFSRLTGPANVLVMPGLQTANISAKLLQRAGRRRGDRADAGRHGAAGPDRGDDRDRLGPGDARRARRRAGSSR